MNPELSANAFEEDLPPTSEMTSEERQSYEARTEQRETAVKQKSALGDLIKSPGWGIVRQWLEAQAQGRIEQLMLTPVKRENIDEQNFIRGEIAMAKLVLKMVSTEFAVATEVVELLKEPVNVH